MRVDRAASLAAGWLLFACGVAGAALRAQAPAADELDKAFCACVHGPSDLRSIRDRVDVYCKLATTEHGAAALRAASPSLRKVIDGDAATRRQGVDELVAVVAAARRAGASHTMLPVLMALRVQDDANAGVWFAIGEAFAVDSVVHDCDEAATAFARCQALLADAPAGAAAQPPSLFRLLPELSGFDDGGAQWLRDQCRDQLGLVRAGGEVRPRQSIDARNKALLADFAAGRAAFDHARMRQALEPLVVIAPDDVALRWMRAQLLVSVGPPRSEAQDKQDFVLAKADCKAFLDEAKEAGKAGPLGERLRELGLLAPGQGVDAAIKEAKELQKELFGRQDLAGVVRFYFVDRDALLAQVRKHEAAITECEAEVAAAKAKRADHEREVASGKAELARARSANRGNFFDPEPYTRRIEASQRKVLDCNSVIKLREAEVKDLRKRLTKLEPGLQRLR